MFRDGSAKEGPVGLNADVGEADDAPDRGNPVKQRPGGVDPASGVRRDAETAARGPERCAELLGVGEEGQDALRSRVRETPPRGRGEGRDPAAAGKGRGQTMEQYCQSGRQ